MPDVIDDMDDLFKKAAENYPLNTDSSDWNEVYKNLQSSESPANTELREKKTKRRFLLWLLLLIPIGVIMYEYNNKSGEIKIAGNTEKTVKKNKIEEPVANKVVANEVNNNNLPKEKITSTNDIATTNNQSSLSDVNTITKTKNVVIATNPAERKIIRTGNNFYTKKSTAIGIENKKRENLLAVENETTAGNIKNNDKEITHTKPTNAGSIVTKKDEADTSLHVKPANENITPTEHKEHLQPMPDTLETSVVKVSKKVTKTIHKQQHLYAGIIAGPDVSTVKFQKTMKTSYTIGLLAGYKLSKRWSIETGLYWDKKNYYSTGKYFNTAKTSIPAYYKVEDLDGNCHMIEWPVNVKYDFTTNKKTNWFALAGVSSYFMKKEDYNYRYKYYGVLVDKKVSYKNSTKNWASILNLSGGYSRRIGKTSTLRIEPYIKIPFSGVGIGSLPIMSSGVYVGFTKTLF